MSYLHVSPGNKLPEEINAIIEIPANSSPVKYEMDKEHGVLNVDRFLSTAMYYPCNYGYIPQTLSEDGDPVDVMVLTPLPLIHGAVIRCRPIGVMKMSDEAGIDNKLLAVPVDKLCALYKDIKSPNDLPAALLKAIAHFFEHYKDLESGKWVKVDGWHGVEHAHAEILSSRERYQSSTS